MTFKRCWFLAYLTYTTKRLHTPFEKVMLNTGGIKMNMYEEMAAIIEAKRKELQKDIDKFNIEFAETNARIDAFIENLDEVIQNLESKREARQEMTIQDYFKSKTSMY